MRQAFISHNKADTPWCKQLRSDLLKRLRLGSRQDLMYLDENMAPGLRWEDHLWDMLERSEQVLVVVSAHAAASKWVRDEVQRAVEFQESDPSRAIIPLLLDTTSPAWVHPELVKYQYADFTHPTKYDESLRRLAYVLKHPHVLNGRAVPLPQPPLIERIVRQVLGYFWHLIAG